MKKIFLLFIVAFATIIVNPFFAQTAFNGVEISQKYSSAIEQMGSVATHIKTSVSRKTGEEWQDFAVNFVGKECKVAIQQMGKEDYVNYFCVTIFPQDFQERNKILTMLLDAYKKKYTYTSSDNESIDGVSDVVKASFRSDDGVIIKVDSYWFFNMDTNRIMIFYYARPQSIDKVDINAI